MECYGSEIERNWKSGDTVDVVIPQPLRLLPIDESRPDVVALLRGAVMYVGLNPWEGIVDTPLALPAALKPVSTQLVRLRPRRQSLAGVSR
jgi:hypothetical protein